MVNPDSDLPLEPGPETAVLLAAGMIRPTASVLELGCGLGDDCVYLATAGCRVLGIDRSPAAIRYAIRRMAAAKRTFEKDYEPIRSAAFRAGDAVAELARLAKRRRRFDVVLDRLLWSNLEPKSKRLRYLRLVAELLQPNGLFVLRVGTEGGGELHGAPDPITGLGTVDAEGRLRGTVAKWFTAARWGGAVATPRGIPLHPYRRTNSRECVLYLLTARRVRRKRSLAQHRAICSGPVRTARRASRRLVLKSLTSA